MSRSLSLPAESERKDKESCRKLRGVIAEDPDWSLTVVPSLSHLCLLSIVRDFEAHPIYNELSNSERDFVKERLPPSLPLSLTANLIEDGVYWRRCCKQQWALCDVSDYGHSWKRMFLEKRLENMIELFIPGVTETQTILDMVPLCKDHVKRLDISQLLTPPRDPQWNNLDKCFLGLVDDDDYDGPPMDHFDFSILLEKLTCLEELHVVYRIKHCGLNYESRMFKMSQLDCESLTDALSSCRTLKRLKLQLSHIDDAICQMLVNHLLVHPSLRELDFSHNMIGDAGAKVIAKLLIKNNLEALNVYDNEITDVGAVSIARALSKNSSLVSLNLCLNHLGDKGGQAIGQALLSNKTLRHLNLGANEVTGATAIALSKVIAQSNTLKSINLSGNNLGEDGGKALQEAMSHNTSITECDIRLTEVDEEIVAAINQVLRTNRVIEKKERTRQATIKYKC